MRHAACITLVAALLAGCTTPYDPPDLVGKADFPGAMTLATKSRENRVRVVMAHGMCSGLHKYSGENNWVAKRAGLIADAIGNTSFVPRDYIPVKQYPDRPGTDSAVQRVDMTLAGDGNVTYELSFLLWGDTFDVARREIDSVRIEDSTGRVPERAWLNARLKEDLMNDCFVDAVAYTGPRGDVVRRNMRAALCELMGGNISGPNTGASSEVVECRGMSRTSETPVMLVPESLGAKVVFDAFLALDDGQGGERKARALGAVKAIHLATHQLPLLDTALGGSGEVQDMRDQSAYVSANRAILNDDAEPPEVENSLNDVLLVLDQGRDVKRGAPPLHVVAYYDPNDMFGYPLTESHLGAKLDIDLTNVIVSNAPTYAGFASNPLDAHGNTARPGIARMIVKGSDALQR